MLKAKFDRALRRLEAKEPLYQLPSGQWKFGGNKFMPANVANRLPIEQSHINNHGWGVYHLRPDYIPTPPTEGTSHDAE